MIPDWAAEYVGIPWLDKGRDRAGVDCWGLVRLAMREQFGVDLPSYAGDYQDAHERAEVAALLTENIPLLGWREVSFPPKLGDGAVFRLLGGPWHVGIALGPEHFLHASEGVGSVAVERFDSYRWARRRWGVFRHEALA